MKETSIELQFFIINKEITLQSFRNWQLLQHSGKTTVSKRPISRRILIREYPSNFSCFYCLYLYRLSLGKKVQPNCTLLLSLYAKPGTNILGPLSFGSILLAAARKRSPRSSELKICSFCILCKKVEIQSPTGSWPDLNLFLIFFLSLIFIYFSLFLYPSLEVPVEDPSN